MHGRHTGNDKLKLCPNFLQLLQWITHHRSGWTITSCVNYRQQIMGELQIISCSKLTMLLEYIQNHRSTIIDSPRIADAI